MASVNLYKRGPKIGCPNCGSSYRQGHSFCPSCGQKSGLGLHSVWQMVMQFFANTFNVDSKLIQTTIGLFKPGFLTREYLAVRRVNYLSPIRVFVVLMFLLFLLLSLAGVDSLYFNASVENESVSEIKEQQLDRAVLLQSLSVDNYINQQLNEIKTLITQRHQHQEAIDEAIQSIQELKGNLALNLEKPFKLTLFGRHFEIKEKDIYQLNSDEIIEKYKVNKLTDQLILRAMLRFTQDPRGFLKFLFGNMTWALLLDVLLMAGIFKLFYPKTRYVVNFVYHLHLRSFIFLMIMLGMGSYWLIPSGWIITLLILATLSYTAISLQRVYPRHKLKSTLYFILFMPLAMMSFFTSAFVVMFISSILF